MDKPKSFSNLVGLRLSTLRKWHASFTSTSDPTDMEIRYTRSTTPAKGRKATILETKNGISHDYSMTISASDEGIYEIVSIRDRFCAYSSEQAWGKLAQKLLKDG